MDVRVAFNQLAQGQEIVNVTCWGNFEEGAEFGQEFADDIRVLWNTHVIASQSNTWSLTSISVTYFPSSGPYTVTYPFTSGPLTGTGAGDPLPNSTAMLASLVHVGSRPNRGRIYFGGQIESNLVAGLFAAGGRNQFKAMVDAWIAGLVIEASTVTLRIGRVDPDGPGYLTTNPVDVCLTRLNPAVQRSRRVAGV